jgi:hypothetical protein
MAKIGRIVMKHLGSPARAEYPGDPNADEALNLIGYPLRKTWSSLLIRLCQVEVVVHLGHSTDG